MEKLAWKQLILEKGKEKQQVLVDNYKGRIKELKGSESFINEGQFDAQQASFNDEQNEKIDVLTGQLNFVEQEMLTLNRMSMEGGFHDEVQLGSVVVTDKMTFFISVSLESFEVDGKSIFGISMNAPIYREMHGKKKGDKFSFNDNHYQIKDLY